MIHNLCNCLMIVTLVISLAGCQGRPAADLFSPTRTDAPPRIVTVIVTAVPTDTPIPVAASGTPAPAAPTHTSSPAASPTPRCTVSALFVADVTIPDGTALAPNTAFVKTWRIKNAGTCDWGAGLTLVFVEGTRLSGPFVIAFPPTEAGVARDVSFSLQAPPAPGAYAGKWHLRDAEGQRLTAVTVAIIVPATPMPTPSPSASPPPSVTPTPTPVPTYAGALESFLGDWRVEEQRFGDNVTDTQHLFKILITQSGSNLMVLPATWPLSPYAFARTSSVPTPYQGGREFLIEFDDSARGHVKLRFRINKACNATVNLDYPGFSGKFIVWNVRPEISCS